MRKNRGEEQDAGPRLRRTGRCPAGRPVRNGRPAFFSVLPGISRPRSGPGGDGQASHLFYGSRRGGDRRRQGGPPQPETIRRDPTEVFPARHGLDRGGGEDADSHIGVDPRVVLGHCVQLGEGPVRRLSAGAGFCSLPPTRVQDESVRPSPCGDSVSFGGRVPPIRREEGGGRLSRFGRVGTGPVGLPEVRQGGKQVLPFRRLGRKTPLRSLRGKGRHPSLPRGGTDLESAPGIVSFRGRACPDSGIYSYGITIGYTEIPRVVLGEAAQKPGGRSGRQKPVKPLFL